MRAGLEFPPGLVGDDTTFDTPGWKDGNNIRFVEGKPETVGGFESLTLDTLSGVCRFVDGWQDADSIQYAIFGQHDALSAWKGGAVADITPASGFTAGNINGAGPGWGAGDYGEDVYGEYTAGANFAMTWSGGPRADGTYFVNPRGQGIFTWDLDTANVATTLSGAPAVCTYLVVLPTNQLAALGCTNVSSTFQAGCIRISDVDDPEEWTPGTTTEAEQHYIQGNGRIVAGRVVQSYLFVWTPSELHLGSYSGSWRFDRMGEGGLAGPGAAAVLNGRAYWTGSDLQFYTAAPGEAPQILPCPFRSEFKENMAPGQGDKIIASTNSEFGEVLFFYPDERDGTGYEVSRVLRVSVRDGAWSKGDIARTAYVDAGALPSPVGVTFEGNIYWHERGRTADGGPLSWSIKTGGQYLDPGEFTALAKGMWPDFRGIGAEAAVGSINFKIYGRFEPQGEEVLLGTYPMNAATQKIDFLHTARIFSFEWTGESAPTSIRFGKPSIEFERTGRR